jgi:hypothetical protein
MVFWVVIAVAVAGFLILRSVIRAIARGGTISGDRDAGGRGGDSGSVR